MPKPTKDTRGLAKAQRALDRQERKAAKLAKRRDAREQPKPDERAGFVVKPVNQEGETHADVK